MSYRKVPSSVAIDGTVTTSGSVTVSSGTITTSGTATVTPQSDTLSAYAGAVLSVSSVSAKTANLTDGGEYAAVANVDIWYDIDATPTVVWGTAPARFLPAGEIVRFTIATPKLQFGAITSAAGITGSVSIYRER